MKNIDALPVVVLIKLQCGHSLLSEFFITWQNKKLFYL